jgi:hypothetical protein
MFALARMISLAILKPIVALALGGAILGMVARICGPRDGVAYVHVSTPGVDVKVDDLAYRVESSWDTPIVCALPPGLHVLRMYRNGTLLYEQEFTIEPGMELVLCAWEKPSAKPAETPTDRPGSGQSRGAAGFTAARRRPQP